MVGDVAGAVGAVASVVGAVADVDEEVIGAVRIYASFVVVAVKLLKLTVNVKPPPWPLKGAYMARGGE